MGLFQESRLKNRYFQCFIIILCCNLLAKNGVLRNSLALDDYTLFGSINLKELVYSQGRYFHVLLSDAIAYSGANIANLSFPLGLIALISQSAVGTAALKFLNFKHFIPMTLLATLAVVHPYSSEILTFRIALPSLIVTNFALCGAMACIERQTLRSCSAAVALISISLFTYQVTVNYVIAIVLIGLAFSLHETAEEKEASFNDQASGRTVVRRCFSLLVATVIAVGITQCIDAYIKRRLQIAPNPRSLPISIDDVPRRCSEIAATLQAVFWRADPLLPLWTKRLSALAYGAASLTVLSRIWNAEKSSFKKVMHGTAHSFIVLTLVPASLGVIIFVRDWWPAARVLAQSSFLYFLLYSAMTQELYERKSTMVCRYAYYAICSILLIQFILIDNNIFSEQQIMNVWDQNKANRVIARLESDPGFPHATTLYIEGGSWFHPLTLQTTYMDLNVSAWAVPFARVHLVNYATGYHFQEPSLQDGVIGAEFCNKASRWPADGATAVLKHIAIVCLPKT
jgi:hypothetical protein